MTREGSRPLPTGVAWALTLLISDLPNIVWSRFAPEPDWLVWPKVALLAVALALFLALWQLRPLWRYAALFLAYLLIDQLWWRIAATPLWESWFGGAPTDFAPLWGGRQARKLGVLATMLPVARAVLGSRQAFFLAAGAWDAPLEPVRWLGIRAGERWSGFGFIFGSIFAGGSLLFVVLAYLPLWRNLPAALGMVPLAVLYALLNGLAEELTMRAPQLGAVHEVLGRGPALAMLSVYFGLAHVLYGMPNGAVGFLMVALVGYLFGKSMLETRGSRWAVLIHAAADVPVFLLYAVTAA
ncbi:MAG: CPBP family intramembrane glutamic endopeptidase [Anaerolineae bacterium]